MDDQNSILDLKEGIHHEVCHEPRSFEDA